MVRGSNPRRNIFLKVSFMLLMFFWHIFEMVSSVWKHHTTQLRKAILALIPAISIARFSFNILCKEQGDFNCQQSKPSRFSRQVDYVKKIYLMRKSRERSDFCGFLAKIFVKSKLELGFFFADLSAKQRSLIWLDYYP